MRYLFLKVFILKKIFICCLEVASCGLSWGRKYCLWIVWLQLSHSASSKGQTPQIGLLANGSPLVLLFSEHLDMILEW